VALVKDKLAEPLHWRKPRRVFVNSMSDLFHEALPDVDIAKVLAVMVAAPWHTFQILTKRPERMRAWIDWSGRARHFVGAWPPKNVWLGVSVEDQATADERVPLLLQTPAAKRFVSYEPALGPVDFGRFLPAVVARGAATMSAETVAALKELARAAVKHVGWSTLDWIIVGAESGPRARPFNPDWARSVRDQCQAAGAPFFYKQDAIKGRKVPTPELDGRRWMEFPT
jgi:protein gp37